MVKPVTLKTGRLLLRPFTMNDVDDMLEYTQDPEWGRYQVNIPPVPYSRKTVAELVAMFSDPRKWVPLGILRIFAITMNGKVIGEIGLNQHESDTDSDQAEIIYTLAYKHWNKGIVTEAARAAMDWVFQTCKLHRLYAYCDPRNTGSWRVMEKLGMKREEQLRCHMKWNGEYRDKLFYGILREEWQSLKKR